MMTETQGDLTGEQVRQLRRLRGWSQKQLAEASGVSQRTISSYETGEHKLHPAGLRALTDVLVVPGSPEATRARWSKDTGLFLDILGALLEAMPEERRQAEMQALFTHIGQRWIPPSQ